MSWVEPAIVKVMLQNSSHKFQRLIKSKTEGRVLLPLPKELVGLMDPGCILLEVGCGTGNLLFQAAELISRGNSISIRSSVKGMAGRPHAVAVMIKTFTNNKICR